MEYLLVTENQKQYPVDKRFVELFLHYYKDHNVTANDMFGQRNRLLYDLFDDIDIIVTVNPKEIVAHIYIKNEESITIRCFEATRYELELKAFCTTIEYIMRDFEKYQMKIYNL